MLIPQRFHRFFSGKSWYDNNWFVFLQVLTNNTLYGKKKSMNLLQFHRFFVYLQHECKTE